MPLLGDALAATALVAAIAVAWVVARKPFLGLGVLVAGMAFHNFVIMVLIRLGANHVLVRAVQSWKEGILALLVVIAVIRLAAFRLAAYIPVLYALGRTFDRPSAEQVSKVAWLVAGAAATVGAFGLYELWLVPTRTWLDWGVNDFSAWLGFSYSGPGHLPENFFQSLPSGLYLRRMVSTYLSPLGIAYTGLLAFPIATVLVARQRRGTAPQAVAVAAMALLVAGVLFSVTRLAIFCLVAEAALLALLTRRLWVAAVAGGLAAAAFAVLTIYPQVGPAVDANLVPGGPDRGSILTTGDPSFLEHLKTLQADARVAARHPLGEGLGSAGTSANRFTGNPTADPDYAPGESAILTTFVDTGLIGGVAYVVLYFLGLLYAGRAALRTRFESWDSALPLSAFVGGMALIPVTLTSDVWGDLSVLFLFWWAVGFTVSRARPATTSTEPAGRRTSAAVPTST